MCGCMFETVLGTVTVCVSRGVISVILLDSVCVCDTMFSVLLVGCQGKVECWDPRVRNRVGMLDCALSSVAEGTE